MKQKTQPLINRLFKHLCPGKKAKRKIILKDLLLCLVSCLFRLFKHLRNFWIWQKIKIILYIFISKITIKNFLSFSAACLLIALSSNIFLYTNRTYLHWDLPYLNIINISNNQNNSSSFNKGVKNETSQIKITEENISETLKKNNDTTITDKNTITTEKITGDEKINNPVDVMDKMTNETLLAILALLLGFAGILSYTFHEIVKRNLEDKLGEKIIKSAREERNASSVENYLSQTYIISRIYQSQEKKDKNLLKIKWKFAKKAFEISKELSDKDNAFIKFSAKNNYLYNLFQQQEEKIKDKKKPCPITEEQIIKLNNEQWKSITSGEAEKIDKTGNIYHWEETCARIFYYVKNKKEKALQIIKSTEENCPDKDWCNRIIEENYPELKTNKNLSHQII